MSGDKAMSKMQHILAGEFGEVYKAHWIRSSVLSSHPAMPEIVAVKTIKGKLCTVIVQL